MGIQWKSEKIERDVAVLITLLEKGSFTTEEANIQKRIVDSVSKEQGIIDDFQLLCFFCKAYDNYILSVAAQINLRDDKDYVLTEKIFEYGNKAIKLAPPDKSALLPLSFVYETLADVHFFLDEYNKAIEYSSKVLDIRPNYKKSLFVIEKSKEFMDS